MGIIPCLINEGKNHPIIANSEKSKSSKTPGLKYIRLEGEIEKHTENNGPNSFILII